MVQKYLKIIFVNFKTIFNNKLNFFSKYLDIKKPSTKFKK